MNKKEIRTCKVHGEVDFRLNTSKNKTNRYRCVKCSSEAVQKRRDKLKLMALELLGNKCKHCGYNKCVSALEFHHIDPSEKEFGIGSKGLTRSFEKIKTELEKCILLCANCHREEHERLRNKNN